jgi:UDP-3-O-[3-hydroxymyristoyl] glucosamine N-acyltransferase
MISLEELSKKTNARAVGNLDYTVSGVDELSTATPQDVSFFSNPKYEKQAATSLAGILCVPLSYSLSAEKNYLVSDNPSKTFQQILEIFMKKSDTQSGFEGIHPTAVIHESAVIGKGVSIGPFVVIDRGVEIEENTVIYAHVFVGAKTVIGKNCLFYSHVTIREGSRIGNRVILQSGSVIGSCGFGYLTDEKGKHHKIPQLGGVVLEDDVEIGANTTIDRARFKSTIISKGTKIDNLVQIGHNVSIGEDSIIVAQCGISGSVKIGKNVVIGGQTGIVGHVEICNRVQIGAQSGVSKSILEPGNYRGFPLTEYQEFNKYLVRLKRVGEYANRIAELEKQLAQR